MKIVKKLICIAFILAAVVVILSGCKTDNFKVVLLPQANEELSSLEEDLALESSVAEASGTIRIASFNIQVFGKTKAEKKDIMGILAKTITEFDIVAIQEIRDKSGTAIKKLEETVDALGKDYEYKYMANNINAKMLLSRKKAT